MIKKLIICILVLYSLLAFNKSELCAQLINLTPKLPQPISGVHQYDEDKTCPGYTLLSPIPMNIKENQKIRLIDMKGNVVKTFNLLGMPAKMFPGGYILGRDGLKDINIQESKTIMETDWNGNIIWSFDHWWQDEKGTWYSRQHHDYEREGFPTGYYSPYVKPDPLKGHTLVAAWENIAFPLITDRELIDSVIYELDEHGNLVPPESGGFFWRTTDHFDELGFTDKEVKKLKRAAKSYKAFDWFHMNTVSFLGENKWYDMGDNRFKPENIIISSRNTNIIAVIDRQTGKIVWKIGPDYDNKPYSKLGQIIGQHHTHMIQKGLPGAGNILLFDNGGVAGYGPYMTFGDILPNIVPIFATDIRLYSRVLEFDPITYDIKWEYIDRDGLTIPLSGDMHRMFSIYIGSVQRLPNGNTLVDEGATGRIIEVTNDKKIVWEYISPYVSLSLNPVYRAYRIPSKWLKDKNGYMLKGDNGYPLLDYSNINKKNNCW